MRHFIDEAVAMSIVLNSYQPLELILRKQLVDDKSDNMEPFTVDTFPQRRLRKVMMR